MFPALMGGFFTTEPPEKSCKMYSRREVPIEDIQMFSTSLGWTCVSLEEENSLCGVRNELGMRVRSTRAGGPQIEEAPSP